MGAAGMSGSTQLLPGCGLGHGAGLSQEPEPWDCPGLLSAQVSSICYKNPNIVLIFVLSLRAVLP